MNSSIGNKGINKTIKDINIIRYISNGKEKKGGENVCPLVLCVPPVPFVTLNGGTIVTKGTKGIGDSTYIPPKSPRTPSVASETEVKSFYVLKGDSELLIASSLLDKDKTLKEISIETTLKYDSIKRAMQRYLKRKSIYFEKIQKKIHLTERGRTSLYSRYEEHLDKNKPEEVSTIGTLNINEYVEHWESFFREREIGETISENKRKGLKYIIINFSNLVKKDIELSEGLLDSPEEVIKTGELALESLGFEDFNIRIFNIPKSQEIKIADIRKEHIGKLLVIEGDVKAKSDPRPRATSAKFECPQCGNIINILQLDSLFKEPTKCGCGRKGKFRLISKEMVDAQGMILQESLISIDENRQPRDLNIMLKDDLVCPLSEKKTNAGSKIKIIGILKDIPITSKTGGILTRFDFVFEANNFETIEETYTEIEIKEEDKKEIIEASKNKNLLMDFTKSIFQNIFGHENEKQSMVLQQFGGSKFTSGASPTRANIHILLVGDPSLGKSDLLLDIKNVAPKSRYCVGSGSSGVGLTGTALYNDFLKAFTIEGGVIPSANKGIALIDEFDKMKDEDRQQIHEAMEQQTITISKANIHGTLPAETAILAVANPKFGKFDTHEDLYRQIDLVPTLISRFDLIFPILDLGDKETDDKITSKIGKRYSDDIEEEKSKPKYTKEFIQKYIAHAKRNFNPSLPKEHLIFLKDYYSKMREKDKNSISPRQFIGMIRLASASAKLRLDNKINREDCNVSVSLIDYCLSKIATDPETGKVDIEKLQTGITGSERESIHLVKEIIKELENEYGKSIPLQDIIKKAQNKNVESKKTDKIIEKLKRCGDIFEPRPGFIQNI